MVDNEVTYSYSYLGLQSSPKTTSGTLFTVRTSDQELQSFSSGGIGGYSHLSPSGTGSFVTISREVGSFYVTSPNTVDYGTIMSLTSTSESSSASGREDGDYTGELLPVGDMLLPMLAMACVYILTKIFRNRKISKAL